MTPACPGPRASSTHGSSCQEKCILLSWRVSATSAAGTSHAFNYFFYPRQKAGQWCKRKQLSPDPEHSGSLPCCSPCSALRLGEGLEELLVQGMSMSANRTLERWLRACRAVCVSLSASWKSPRWPSLSPYRKITSIHNWSNQGQLEEGFFSWKGPKNQVSSVRHTRAERKEKRSQNNKVSSV